MSLNTADICDNHASEVQVLILQLISFGKIRSFFGPIVTLDLFEDNSLVRTTLEKPGNGQVLIIDGKGSMKFALLGDQLASLASKNGWAGIIVNGPIRDSQVINKMDLCVKALGTNPRKTVKRGLGTLNSDVTFGEVTFTAGHYVYADDDGVLVSKNNLLNN